MALLPTTGPDLVRTYQLYQHEATSTLQQLVKHLLEAKHMYQSVELRPAEISDRFKDADEVLAKAIRTAELGLPKWPWPVEEDYSIDKMMQGQPKAIYSHLTWKPLDLKLYCKVCGRVEPFNSSGARNLFNRNEVDVGGLVRNGKLHQLYTLSFLCQSCKLIPEVFLIRRVGLKLTLCGRAPMEHTPVPKEVPKLVSEFYGGAVIAHQSGQTLAGLFLLRTVCEQWAQKFADRGDRADMALDKYTATLPADFKERFPSLQKIYTDLSAAVHSADASTELFEKTVVELVKHFNARALFGLAGPPAVSTEPGAIA